MTQHHPRTPADLPYTSLDLDTYDYDEDNLSGPSLPIILLSSASAVGFSILSFFFAYEIIRLRLELSAGIATFSLLIVLGIVGTGLSAVIGSRSTLSNLGFSCGLILIMGLFFSLCMIGGAFAAMLLTFASA